MSDFLPKAYDRGEPLQAGVNSGIGEYINACTNALNPMATTDVVETISLDVLELDIRKALYGCDEKVKKRVG